MNRVRWFTSVIFIVFLINNSKAQLWKSYPVWGGGEVLDVIQDVTDTNVYYCTTKISGVFKSVDGGQSWKSIMSDLNKQYYEHYYVRGFAINPLDHKKLYALCGQAPWTHPNKAYLFRSNDSGNSWVRIDLPFSVASTSQSCWGKNVIVVNPSDTSQLFCGAQMQYDFTINEWKPTGGVYRSADGGLSWNLLVSGIEYMWVSGMAMAPADYGNKLIVAAERYIINNDTSTNWGLYEYNLNTEVFHNLFSERVIDFDFDAGSTGVLMILSDGRLYVSSDKGNTWSPYINPLWHYVNFYIKAHPTESGHWYLGNYNWNYSKILETLNYGASWNVCTYYTGSNKNMISYPYKNECSFTPEFSAFPNSFTISKSGKLGFLSDNKGIWKTSDLNKQLASDGEEYNNANWNWTYANKGLNIVEGRKIIAHPNGKVFLCGTYTPLFYTSDNGNTTVHINLPDDETTQVSDVVFSSANTNIIYAAGSRYYNGNCKIFKSTDGGINWQKLAENYFTISGNNINNVLELAISTYSADTILAGVSTLGNQVSVHRSVNGGIDWHPWSEGLPSNQIFQIWHRDERFMNDGNGTYYLQYQDKLYSRRMTETQWQLTNLPQQGWLANICIRENEPGALYLVKYNNRIYKTTDRGANWTEIHTDPITCNYKIAASPAGILAVMSCEDNSNDVAQKLFVSFNNGYSFTEIALNGITGMIRGITFVGAYTLAAWSENSGYYFVDLNLVNTRDIIVNTETQLVPNPSPRGIPINIGKAFNVVRLYNSLGVLQNTFVNTSQIFAPSEAGLYLIETLSENEHSIKELIVLE